ncbi:putative wall-associated receptor kinase-like protein 16 [Cinnamomum micranthum f. kanehirae]|uniref:Putative wall-associated receptor kinase-like protein 16 n=1 Tax=Cinnamomum micranthum f. kanehirae TaxID=337451 RepID=A0A443NLD7_9MAGN|nr:putative wall-associated receptor kinase-like protein 16 [Cinnamomum micranthum f. kanehirae]
MILHFFLQFFYCLSIAAAADVVKPNPGCQHQCGNVRIPYPFGIGDPSCYRDQYFNLTCRKDIETDDLKPFWGELEVLNISTLGEMTVGSPIGWDCYFQNGSSSSRRPYSINLYSMGPFTFSDTRNKLTAVGCDNKAYINGSWGSEFTSGCMSYCKDEASVTSGSCNGIGCCQSFIPAGIKKFKVTLESFSNHSQVWEFNRCSYSYVGDKDQFNFSVSDLHLYNFWDRSATVPVVLDWMAANETCEKAKANKADYACRSAKSDCYYSDNLGYGCKCLSGYQGNPYIQGGCQDIDECLDQTKNPCKGNCNNTVGSFICTCPEGTHGDPHNKEGDGCIKDSKEFPVLKVFLGTGLSLLFLFIGSTWTCWIWRKRKMIKLKEKFFHQNGGLLLQRKISSRRAESFKIFTTKELDRATENYSLSRIVGQGGYGIVYKGTLPDNRIIAVKKSKIVDASQIEQFINEVDILSQINHRNVVKLLGCCLEDQVPLLVYEFVSNGTLYSHIHETSHTQSMSLQNRLRIAIETAEALAYLHSAASIPIFHRDVKSSNILLDDSLTAKVSDFGASRLVPIDQTQITTLVQGTLGYLDPEYFQTGQLTAKSDVYSFGVVLVELLTAEKPICPNRSQEERNLAMHFISAMKENRILQVLEDRVLHEGQKAQLIAIARLAKRCLKLKGEERPTMKEVVVELQGLRGFHDHPWVNNNIEETESLLVGASQGCTSEASGQYGFENHFISIVEDGR